MQQHVVCSWAQAASLGSQAMLCSTLQLWSLASKFRKTWRFWDRTGAHTHTADLAVPGVLQNKCRLLQQQQEQHLLQVAYKVFQNNSPNSELHSN